MIVFNKKELLAGLRDRVELIRNNLRPFLRLPDETLLHCPARHQWSVAEIFEHLTIMNGAMLQAMQKAMHKAPIQAREVFRCGWMGNWLYNKMMPRPNGSVFRLKTLRRYQPGPGPHYSRKVIDRLLNQLDEFDHVLECCAYLDIQTIRLPFLFPLALRLRMGDGLRCMVAHCERHLFQARRVLEQQAPA